VVAQDEDCIYQPGELITQVINEYDCAVLNCKNLTRNNTDYEFDGWILPDVTYINRTYDDGKVAVDDEEWTITVRNISHDDTGLYHCMLIQQGEYHLVRMGLNAKGPFFITGWEEYEMNTIVGLSAFGSFIILTVLVYLLHHFRYQADDDDDDVNDFDKQAIDAFGVDMGNHGPTPFVAIPASNANIPAYTPCQDISITSEVRKRSPAFEKKLANGDGPEKALRVTAAIEGVINPAFMMEKRSSIISDKSVNEFMSPVDEDNVEMTEL
jgi:hypothetical protein